LKSYGLVAACGRSPGKVANSFPKESFTIEATTR
jgi:hypothetical protein